MSGDVEALLAVVPEESVLFSVSPSAARQFGILPVGVRQPEGSGEKILDVVGIDGEEEIDGAVGWQMFRKIPEYVGRVSRDVWEAAYSRFYAGLL